MTPTAQELRSAVKYFEQEKEFWLKAGATKEQIKQMDILLALAQSVLSATELPEGVTQDNCKKCDFERLPADKRERICSKCVGFNSALSQSRLVVARLKAEIAELEAPSQDAKR